MLGFFKREPLLDKESIEWLFEAFGWSLRSFGSAPFYQNTILVTPTPRHFPGSGTSIEAMADLMMNRVKGYAGLSYWPTQAIDHHQFRGDPNDVPSVHQMLSALAGEGAAQSLVATSQAQLILFYEPKQVGNPEVMIANFSHALMVHLAALAELAPPCDPELLPHLTEVMAVTHGLGLMFANTATPHRGGCGSCRSPAMERVGNLSEREVAYALAIFCVLKEVPEKAVTRHLKKTLKGFFKKALKDVGGHETMLADLKAIEAPSHFNKHEAAIPA
ncbi:MAG: hypothetical protein COB33_007395 [Thiotrichaceae bacterium]|nr:hypothetical protein [Thiotrichaceae bacterium]